MSLWWVCRCAYLNMASVTWCLWNDLLPQRLASLFLHGRQKCAFPSTHFKSCQDLKWCRHQDECLPFSPFSGQLCTLVTVLPWIVYKQKQRDKMIISTNGYSVKCWMSAIWPGLFTDKRTQIFFSLSQWREIRINWGSRLQIDPPRILQCSCLENPRDGEAWSAAIYGVAQSRTRLKWLSSSRIHFPHEKQWQIIQLEIHCVYDQQRGEQKLSIKSCDWLE